MAKCGPKGPSKYTQEFIEKEAEALLQYAEESPLPFLNKFTVDRGYYPEVISQPNWVNNKSFSQALKKAKALLEYKLTVGCLANKLNPAMAIFALKNVAGWRDNALIDQSKHFHLTYGYRANRVTNSPLRDKARESQLTE